MNTNKGFTLIELLVVAAILSVVLTGMIKLFIYTSVHADLAGNKTIVVSELQDKIEEMRQHDFALIATDYGSGGTPGNTFALSDITGMGVISIDSSNAELLEITVSASWEDRHGRIIGEDANLDGDLDAGEDKDSDSTLDFPVTLMTKFTRR